MLLGLVIAHEASRPGAQTTGGPASPSGVRSTVTWVLDLLREGEATSATFRTVVTALGRTDAIVYVEPGICAFGRFHACLPAAVSTSGGVRYLRVLFEPARAPRPQLIALIGHELQHALEVATVPGVRSSDGIRRLFGRVGQSVECPKGMVDCFETTAARDVGDRILAELEKR